jgi:hypothetical protein
MAEKYDKAAHAARLIAELGNLGIKVTVGEQKAIPPSKTTSSVPTSTRTTTSQPYKDPGKYDPFPNKGAGMGSRTKAWSPEAQAIGQGSARGVTGQRPAQQGNTMQGGFTRGPGGLPQRSGPPLGRSAGYGPMPLGPVASRSAYQPGLPPNMAQPPQNGPAGAPLGSFQAAYGRMGGQLPNSPLLPQQAEAWRPPMAAPLPSAHRGMIELGPPGSIGAQGPEEEQRWWNPFAGWTMDRLLGR